MPDEKNYEVRITASLINSIFCGPADDVQAIMDSDNLLSAMPTIQDWMRFAIRHPDGTHMTKEEADAVFDDMPIEEYFMYIGEIIAQTASALEAVERRVAESE